MKKTIIVTSLIFFLVPSLVFAQDITTSNSSVSVKVTNNINTNKPVKEDIRIKIEAKREEIEVKLTAKNKERIRSFSARIVTRIEALIERLNILITRLETRIVKINEGESDIDTKQATADIAEAKLAIASASSNLVDMSTALENLLNSEDPKYALAGARDIVKEIKTDMQKVHTLLVHATGELKGLRVGGANEE